MDWLWTWDGRCFGYRSGADLWTHDGQHVGHFYGEEVYGPDGRYLGEVRSDNRLITDSSKQSRRKGEFAVASRRVPYAKPVNYAGYHMLVGYEDFPTF